MIYIPRSLVDSDLATPGGHRFCTFGPWTSIGMTTDINVESKKEEPLQLTLDTIGVIITPANSYLQG
jgi:hypothetical protein